MARRHVAALLFVLAAGGLDHVEAAQHRSRANPVRKVITLLQAMSKKVVQEGKEADKLFTKFMCYCKNSAGPLATEIQAAQDKIPSLVSTIKAGTSKSAQLEKDLSSHRTDRKAAEDAISEAVGIREKDKATFDKDYANNKADYNAIMNAVAALKKGMGANFLQTEDATVMKKWMAAKQDVLDADRDDIMSFLTATQESDYSPQSGEILGILKQMGDEEYDEQQKMVKAEEESLRNYEEVMKAKKEQVAVLSKSIELKLARVADIGVAVEVAKNDLEDTRTKLADNEAFLKDLKKNCKTNAGIHEKEAALRQEEIAAIGETIKILNDDDALELFKKTLPSASAASAASFLQIQVTEGDMQQDAQAVLADAKENARPRERARLSFITQALRGKKVGFDKVIGFIDKLRTTLKNEQNDDDEKKGYCEKKFDESEDQKKGLERSVADVETVIEEAKEAIETLVSDIQSLKDGIVQLDQQVAEATSQRKKENKVFKEVTASSTAAKELLLLAKKRLNKFYNPKLALDQEDGPPAPPPETAAAFKKKSGESAGALSMINILVGDLEKEMAVAKVEEDDSQKEYEELVADSATKRAADSKALTNKESSKSQAEGAIEKSLSEKKSASKELAGVLKFIQALHSDCDWLVKYYDVRKKARSDEIDALGKAKDVLKGASYS